MLVVGVAGGSASGKTTLVSLLTARLTSRVAILPHDAYYRANPHLSLSGRQQINYDHPDSLETSLMVEHVEALQQGRPIERPVYDYSTHLRCDQTCRIEPCDILILEGILVLAETDLRALMELKVFVHTSSEVRLERRLKRDLAQRGRTAEFIRFQNETMVGPMHDRYVEPSRSFADIEIDGEDDLGLAADRLALRLTRAVRDGDDSDIL